MKKIYLIALFILTTITSSWSQILDLENEVNEVFGSTSILNEEISAHWDVINISSTTREISCRREMILEVPGSTGRFCWGFSCSPVAAGNQVLDEIVVMESGDTSTSFRGYYRHNGNPGVSIARYCWFDAAVPADQVCFDVSFCVDQTCTIGVEEYENHALLEILGNPVSSLSGISYRFSTEPKQAELSIYSATGMLAAKYNLSSAQGFVMIDAEQMANGVYTCKLNENGRTVGIQRMVVSK